MVSPRTVYLDHSASTPTDPRVVEAMLPFFSEVYGNASSMHSYGRKAERAIEDAREMVATILNCKASEVVFTSGGSEGDNLALRGAAWAQRNAGKGCHLLTSSIEHEAVSRTVGQLADIQGFTRTLLPVDHAGMCDVAVFADAAQEDSVVASVIYASNEVGTIQPISTVAHIARQRDVIIHTDAVQAAGQLPLDVQALGVDLLSVSAHKFYGPKGVGALFVRDGVQLASNQTGGSHEDGRRAGTHNTPLIVGLARALELAYDEFETRVVHYRTMRDCLIEGIVSAVPAAQLTGHPTDRLPSHASFVIEGVDSSVLLMHLDVNGIAASSGSACKTGNPEPSKTLLAMGYDEAKAVSGLRLTVGQQTTEEDIAYTVAALSQAVKKIREMKVTH